MDATIKRSRERVGDRESLRGEAKSLAALLFHSQLTHTEFLTKRTERLFNHPAWHRVPSYVHVEIFGYLNAATDIVHFSGLVQWCHKDENGEFVPSHTREWDYSKIDPNDSRHCWANGKKVWFDSSPERLPLEPKAPPEFTTVPLPNGMVSHQYNDCPVCGESFGIKVHEACQKT